MRRSLRRPRSPALFAAPLLLALSGAVASPASATANALTVDVECDNGGYRAACSAFKSVSTPPVTRQAGGLMAAASSSITVQWMSSPAK